MTVTLNIASDEELRNYIKDMVKGQVLAITRDEVNNIVQEEIHRKLKGISTNAFDVILQKAATESVGKALREQYGLKYWDATLIKPYVQEVMEKTISHNAWMKVITDIATKQVNSAIAQKLAS